MTDEELIEELSEMGRHPCRAHLPMGETLRQAASRIEALTAENFKLAAGSCDVEGGKVGDEHGHFYCTLQKKVEAQAAEISKWRTVSRVYLDRIETLRAEIERLKNKLSVETEPSPYCPICGSCGDEGCCGSKRCMYPAAEWQAGYEAGIEAAANALEADAKKCDCAAYEENECDCGAWYECKSITSARAVEIVRALKESK